MLPLPLLLHTSFCRCPAARRSQTSPKPHLPSSLRPRTSLDPLAEPGQTPGLLRGPKTTIGTDAKLLQQKMFSLTLERSCSVNHCFLKCCNTNGTNYRYFPHIYIICIKKKNHKNKRFSSFTAAACTRFGFFLGGGADCCQRVWPKEKLVRCFWAPPWCGLPLLSLPCVIKHLASTITLQCTHASVGHRIICISKSNQFPQNCWTDSTKEGGGGSFWVGHKGLEGKRGGRKEVKKWRSTGMDWLDDKLILK